VELRPVNVRDVGEMDRAVAAFAATPNGGLIVTASSLAYVHRDAIIALAARQKLPAVYFARPFVTAGGLASYGLARGGVVPRSRAAGTPQIIFLTAFKATALRGHWRGYYRHHHAKAS